MMKRAKLFLLATVMFIFLSACNMLRDDEEDNDEYINNEIIEIPTDETQENETYENDEAEENGGLGEDGGVEIPAIIIEIHEDRIIFDGDEIYLEDFEEIVRANSGLDIAWVLSDAHQASRVVYNDVVEVLNRHGIAFTER